ncbi:beta-ketoacyl synthase N-terminal-like domain-containing protein [Limosilactobacillus reuteri]|nr:beta-ketoacyl synthase N-terminal-like domain-containing protein [Limosilactobacillus reuteri]AJO68336.1 RtcPKS [Limosilactobacillus reuteri]KEK15819.1 polyketide synthase [Limosilactobacillus reuteri]KEK16436.1 polyketide synthase [Limosilactobacillus reuteri]KEQ20581.1 polyketide synthase [Limosilactobacillus reuteri]KGE70107.1 polyketide synthase [Limosilactobacillus reuteri]
MKKYAIIGIALDFPQAHSTQELFNNLLNGKTSFRKLTPQERKLSPYFNDKNFVPITSSIDNPFNFDNNFFNMSNSEANITDPQQRIFLKCCYNAMEDASLFSNLNQRIGVFASSAQSTYLLNQILTSKGNSRKFDYSTFIGNVTDFNPTRVSYKLDLTGPSMAIQSGCSSSLVALNEACQNLSNDICDVAIVGGVSISFPLNSGYSYKTGSTFSRSGHMCPFDEKSDGMVTGNGCGVIIIKDLKKARINRDNIYAIISGIGINNDGNTKVGYTAPSIVGEKNAIKEALNTSKIIPEQVDYIETHGTGTKLGDQIEVRALKQAYKFKSPHQIGTIKSNIGHLDTASGIAGLIKAALMLRHNIIPKSTNFDSPNPQLKLEDAKLFIDKNKTRSLNPNEKHYIGVSSFGIGGTNVHVILENNLTFNNGSNDSDNQTYVIQLSAKNVLSLEAFRNKLITYLKKNLNLRIEDIARTLNYGRKEYQIKERYSANSVAALITELKQHNTTSKDKSLDKVGKFISLPTYSFQETLHTINNEEKATNTQTIKNDLISICNIWAKALDEEVSENSNFFNLDGDSLIAVGIIEEINESFKTHLSPEDLLNNPTPKKLFELIQPSLKHKLANNIVQLQKCPTNNKNIFLFHPAGGSIFCFRQLVKYIDIDGLNIYAVSFPSNITKNISLHDLASYYVNEILKIQNDDEFLLGGYSFGGNIAVEIARQLEQKGKIVKNVYLIDSLVPNAYPNTAPSNDEYLQMFPLAWKLMTNPQSKINALNLTPYKNISLAIKHLRNQNEIPADISDNKINELFNIWVNNHKALVRQNTEPINANLVVFSATDNMPNIMYQNMHMKKTTPFEWGNYSNGNLKIIPISGNHFTIMSNKNNLNSLATLFKGELQQ